MNFRIDTDTWFVFSILFIAAFSVFMIGLILFPLRLRRRQLKRIRFKYDRRKDQLEKVEKKSIKREISDLALRNQVLESSLQESLQEIITSDFDIHQINAFYAEFEKVYPSFSTSLCKLFPTITAHELKLCSLIRLNLSAKEISRIMNISPASVNTGRYRLRKKMALKAKDDLDKFLLSI